MINNIRDINDNIVSPFLLKISFNKLLEHYENLLKGDDQFIVAKARRVLETQSLHPILREGFSEVSLIETYKNEIDIMLQDAFSPVLTKNEIKAASMPFHDLIFNPSERFKDIIKTAGKNFKPKIKTIAQDEIYISACTVILNFCYGYDLNFKRPFYFEVPDANGIMRYYKILYNADFCEIIPGENAPKITDEDYAELIDNFDNIEIWKTKFPPNSYLFKGFVICNIFDVTIDQSISNIKSALISEVGPDEDCTMRDFHDIFQSFLEIKDLQVGFSIYNKEEDIFERVYGNGMESYLLNNADSDECCRSLCDYSYNTLIENKKFFSISDIDKYYEHSKGHAPQISILKEQGFKSAILAPIADEDRLLGILELVSKKPKVLNSVKANKLVDVMPFIVSAVRRSKYEEENLIEAIIQQECTSIHPSVHWKFRNEAKKFIQEQFNGNEVSFNKIVFEKVYPLYGQIDIKRSTEARNRATKQDLTIQLNAIRGIVEKASSIESLPIYEQFIFQIDQYLEDLQNSFQVDSEQHITSFIDHEINPLLLHLEKLETISEDIQSYKISIDKQHKVLYNHRKKYDDTIASINTEMASLLDKKQVEAQNMYPHYFERFKTDGVEHNMYIGESITKEENFSLIYLYNLRLWQLQVMCEMENVFYQMQSNFPIQMDVASMILVFNQPLSISFRMDEKQFDVDGTYNARYEIVKKRVDKAYIKGTNKRITEKGKMTIVYSQKQDEIEYLGYIKFLQSKHYLGNEIEIVELEDLQAVTGLKAIRANILYHKDNENKAFYTYDDLMKELKT